MKGKLIVTAIELFCPNCKHSVLLRTLNKKKGEWKCDSCAKPIQWQVKARAWIEEVKEAEDNEGIKL